jgi:DNA-binding IscR family transcriptional regulator
VGALVRVLEGDTMLVDCASASHSCVNEPRGHTPRVRKAAANAMIEKLETITFAELVQELRRNHMLGLLPDLFPDVPESECRTARDMAATFRHP